MASEELIKHQQKIAYKRRVYAQARAILQRGKDAGIPEKYLRIPKKEFQELLCSKYHSNAQGAATKIYDNADILFKKSFIVIDGGDLNSRKKAGFALLFRMIACDKRGLYQPCSKLAGLFETIKFGAGENRNEVVQRIKNEPILFLNEFHPSQFNPHFDAGNFFDQLLEYRDDYSKPTILTFTNPLQKGFLNNGNAIRDTRCGAYLAMLSQADEQKNDNVFRIKLK
jgi:hypothetical protein